MGKAYTYLRMTATNKLAVLVSLCLCLLGGVLIIGGLGADKWLHSEFNGQTGDSGFLQSCSNGVCTPTPAPELQDCDPPCSSAGTATACEQCKQANGYINAGRATVACGAIACIFFLIGAIVEIAALVGKDHAKKGHGIACLMLFAAIFAFASIAVFGVHIYEASGASAVPYISFGDSFNLIGVAGGVAVITMLISIFVIAKGGST